uniref:Uncharacterized protein AlNc14C26G2548 n=1 Tax=Albugo laibachii Nc14 TaxID=890382 RepID=F0W6R2_9STRA|nr:conserved hypothetical protein [Albugo laibachii Nc14]|eukprot:CCA16807.1 conserved hypothetical protein [Albugo laibachii Nc14]
MTITQTVQNQLFGNDKVIRLALEERTRKNRSHFVQSEFSDRKNCNDPTKQPFGSGKAWTHGEHARFLEALDLYPSGPWKIIAAYVGSKTTRQTMTHAQKYRQKIERRRRGLRTRTSSPSKKWASENAVDVKLSAATPVSVPTLIPDAKSFLFDFEDTPGSPSSVELSLSGALYKYPTNIPDVQGPPLQNIVTIDFIGSAVCHPQSTSIPTNEIVECSSGFDQELFTEFVQGWEPLTFTYNSDMYETLTPFIDTNDFEAELAMTDDIVDMMLAL